MYVIAYECDTQGVVSHGELRVQTVKNSLKGGGRKKEEEEEQRKGLRNPTQYIIFTHLSFQNYDV